MNCKNLHLILAFLAFALIVLSSPIKRKQCVVKSKKSKDVAEVSDNEPSEVEVTQLPVDEDSESSGEEKTDIPVLDDTELCDTPECRATAERILSNIDQEVNPCDDFYEFACGNWMKTHEIPEDQSSIGSFDNISKQNIKILTDILNGEYQERKDLTKEQQKVDREIYNELTNLFKTCMNTDGINEKGKEPLDKLLEELKIHNEKADYSKVDELTDLLVKLHSHGVNVLFDHEIFSDNDDPKLNVFYIQQAEMTLPSKEYYENQDIYPAYQEAIHDMLKNVFPEKSEEEIQKLAGAVFDFESKLAKISISGQEVQSAYYSPEEHKRLNIETIGETYKFINWKKYFEDILAHFKIEKKFNKSIPIVDVTHTYFEQLEALLKETDSETLAAFAEWNVISKYSRFIGDDVRAPMKKLNKVLTGVEGDGPRNDYCINSILEGTMGMAAGKLFIDRAFGGDSKKIAESIIENVREAMVKRIPNMSWLDEQTAEYAVLKAKDIEKMIGYPDYINDPVELAKDYKGLEISADDFFSNVANSNEFNIGKTLATVFEPVKFEEWQMTPQTVNAYYEPTRNQIVFPAGILQIPFFESSNPGYLNYGGFGAVAGHELTHAFDNSGKDYDMDGKYNSWWTNSTDIQFNELAKCFIDQYSSFYIEDKSGKKYNVNGELTLGENLADNGGVDRAYEAWKLSLEQEGAKENNKLLPGLTKYNQDQLFYIAFGQIWCTKRRPEMALKRVQTDVHSPPQFRVNGVISNSKKFSEVFNCPADAKMNPKDKCVIW